MELGPEPWVLITFTATVRHRWDDETNVQTKTKERVMPDRDAALRELGEDAQALHDAGAHITHYTPTRLAGTLQLSPARHRQFTILAEPWSVQHG